MPLSHRCHWAPSSHRLRIAGPATIAIRRCRALYPSRRTPLPSRCIRLRRRTIVRCHRRRARCACFVWLVSILWHGAWAVGLSMGWWRGRCWGPLRVACVAVVVAVCHRRCRRFVVSHDRHCVLVRNTWALQPGGGWLRGVALAPPDCGGGCTLWWVLVVAVRAVGHWATSAALLCAMPGPLGLVDGGRGGCWWCPPIAVAVTCHRGRWWVVARERWEWGDRRRTLACNTWVFRPGG